MNNWDLGGARYCTGGSEAVLCLAQEHNTTPMLLEALHSIVICMLGNKTCHMLKEGRDCSQSTQNLGLTKPLTLAENVVKKYEKKHEKLFSSFQ